LDKKKRIRKVFLILAIVLVAGLAAAFIGFKIYTSHYYVSDRQTIEGIEQEYSEAVSSYSDDNRTVFLPKGKSPKAVIVFYPGGKVEYTAYSGLMYKIAAKGYICLLPRMPENLAFLDIDAADEFTGPNDEASLVADLDWYLAGHSLGGVAASKYLAGVIEGTEGEQRHDFTGLILCASYTTDDFSDSDVRLLSVYASNDGVINKDNYNDSKSKWPADASEYVIEGGIHSYFGSYGIQSGDGVPAITNEEQLNLTADAIDQWIQFGR
jgi:hypothetical protein